MAPTRRYRKSKKRKKRRKTKRRRRQLGGKSRLNKMKRRLKRLKRKITRKQRGGGLLNPSAFKCNNSSNMGEFFTKIPNNTNPFLPDPISSNNNLRVPRLLKSQNGGGFMDNFGLGDALLGWYKGTNAVNNLPIRYKGGKQLMPADPTHQPGLTKAVFHKTTSNIPLLYEQASAKAAKNTIS
jgi:hypothetical protein